MFKWKESFSCNIETIDTQHKRLFELGSRLYAIYSFKDGFDHYDEIMEVLTELKNYTHYHFNYEEELLKRYNYSELEEQIKEHQAFIDEIEKLESEEIDERQTKVTMDILVFISNWIEKHILRTDLNYSKFLNSKGVF